MAHAPHDKIPSNQITPPELYFNRRTFMRAGVLAATTVATGLLYRNLNRAAAPAKNEHFVALAQGMPAPTTNPAYRLAEPATSLEKITHYNNFYEFSTDKESVAPAAEKFVARPWTVTVDGLVRKKRVFDLDSILALAPLEERVYRMRCVEAWSMVIPWDGFQLSALLSAVEPLSSAKFVAFETLFDPQRMPNQNRRVLGWPYIEGLRMDEAMHPLTLLAAGIYGKAMPPQNGAPLRLVVPWKYGFKGIKSIVKITLTDTMPRTTWSAEGPREYGFYANVNPLVDHPRWSQASEDRLGPDGHAQRDTLMFNGYGDQVASLYSGMDLTKFF